MAGAVADACFHITAGGRRRAHAGGQGAQRAVSAVGTADIPGGNQPGGVLVPVGPMLSKFSLRVPPGQEMKGVRGETTRLT